MTHQELTYVNMVILIVLAVLISAVITMVLWLISLARELRSEILSQIADSRRFAHAEGHDEIRALRAREPGGPLTHTDDRGP